MLFLHSKIFCHWAIFCCSMVRSERAFFNRPHSFKHVALLTGMLYVNNTAYTMQKYWLFQKGYCSFERRVRHLEMHTALLQRAWCKFSRNTSYFVRILPLQKHTALPQRKITLIQKGMFVLNAAFAGRYGDVVIILKSSSIFCRNYVLLKGHSSSIYLR